jgi:hypothetical protein
VAGSYEIVTRDRSGREHVREYTSGDDLAPGSVVVLGGRSWLVTGADERRLEAAPARYRLTLRHPDGSEESGVFRRLRPDAPTVGHQLTTLEDGAQASWAVVEQRLARDDAGEPFLELTAERDYAETESLPDHQLEHALEQDREDDEAGVPAALARAQEAGQVIELAALEAGEAPDWDEARRYIDSLVFEEIEDDVFEMAGVDTRHDRQETWLATVQQRLRDDLESFRDDIEGDHDEIEEWDFRGGRIFAAAGRWEDESNPLSGYGWMRRLDDSEALGAAGFQRVYRPFLP